MGEVYRARDTRLDRIVAVKILPEHLSSNPQLRERFEREARAISSLSHPNICSLYDVGQQNGIDYLVMEHLEGETLAGRLKKGPLPTDQVLQYAIQITDALDTAHKHAVVHRDLKPGNIMLTKTGAKLLDFGLAKVRSAAAATGMTALPTQTTPLTGEGTILGTLQYMAPEQLEGAEADARTDIFALGAVIYEMATGRKAFGGKSHASLISAIMSAEPPAISTLQPLAPAPLDHVVRTCLEKEPDARWQTAHDVVLELRWIAGSQGDAAAPPARATRPSWKWMVAAAVLPALAVGITWYFTASEPVRPAMKVSILAPENAPFEGIPAISPDGRRLAFAALGPSRQTVLWVRSLDSLTSVPIPGTEGALDPFWSPDSRFVGFFAEGKMKKVSAELGPSPPPVQTLVDAPDPRGGAWSHSGFIVFARNIEDGLYRVPVSGGEVTRVTTLDRNRHENSHRWPHFLLDGRHLLYLARSSMPEHQGIYVGTPGSEDWKLLLRTPLNAVVARAPRRASPGNLFSAGRGYLLFMLEQTLVAQSFELDRMKVTGEIYPIAEAVGTDSNRVMFSVSEESSLAYRTVTSDQAQPRWFDRAGKLIGTSTMLGAAPRLSPDGRQVAFYCLDRQSGAGDIWLEDVSHHVVTRLTSHPGYDWMPIWSPDGNSIVFASNRDGPMDLYQKPVSGSEPERQILKSDRRKIPDDWSHDGRFLVFEQADPKTNWDLWALPMDGDRKPFPILQSESNEIQCALSPDGKWLTYSSDEAGGYQVYVQPFAGRSVTVGTGQRFGARWRISTDGGAQPRWRSDGKELFYVGADRKIMSVAVKTVPAFEAGMPSPLFASTISQDLTNPQYDVAPDGKRFLISAPSNLRGSAPVTVVLNWTAGLKP